MNILPLIEELELDAMASQDAGYDDNLTMRAAGMLRDLLKDLDESVKSSREWGDVLVSKDRRSEADPYYWMAAGLEEFRNELSGQNAKGEARADNATPPPHKTI